jgi:O-antigen ligase
MINLFGESSWKHKYNTIFIAGTLLCFLIIIISFILNVDLLITKLFLFIIFLFYLVPLLLNLGINNIFILLVISTFMPFEFTFGGVQGWELIDFMIPLMFFLLFVFYAVNSRRVYRIPPGYMPVLVFILIALAHILTLKELPEILSSLASFDIPAGGFRFYYDILIFGLIYFITPFFFNEESHINLFIQLLIGLCIFIILFGFLRIFMGLDTISADEAYRTRIHYVPAGDSVVPRLGIMGVAGYLLFVLGLIFVKDKSRRLFFLFTAIAIAGIIQSGGRAVFLGLVLAISLYLFFTGRKIKAILLPAGLIILLFFIGLHPGLVKKFPDVLYRHLTIFAEENPSFSRYGNTRMEMWTISMEMILENPLWGSRSMSGLDEFDESAFANVRTGGAHNVYLSTATSLGLPALILWIFIAVYFFRRIIFLHRETAAGTPLNRFCFFLAILLGVSYITFFLQGGAGGGFTYFLYLGLIDASWAMYGADKET